MGVQKVDGELAGDEAGDGRDDGEGFLLFQHVGGSDVGVVSDSIRFVSAARYGLQQPRYW
jgi:hypothetical protein